MKKVLLLTLTLSLLASCANSGEVDSTKSDSVDSEVSSSSTQEDTTDEQGDDTTEGAEAGDYALNEHYAQAIMNARDEDANNFNPIIVDEEDEFADYIFPLLAFEPETAQGFAISVPSMNAQAYGIIAILPVAGQEDTIMAGMQQFIDTQIQNFTGYLPDQLEIAQSVRLETLGDGTILLVMCPEQDVMFDSIVANL